MRLLFDTHAFIRDPFDRLLAVQARIEELTLITRDPAFRPYGVKVFSG